MTQPVDRDIDHTLAFSEAAVAVNVEEGTVHGISRSEKQSCPGNDAERVRNMLEKFVINVSLVVWDRPLRCIMTLSPCPKESSERW